MKQRLKKFIKKQVFKLIKPPVNKVNNSNAQAGEDLILSFLFSSMGLSSISYIDIGSNDPIICNNTYLFYARSKSGLLVEPDLFYLNRTKKYRPKDKIIQAAVSDEEGEVDFYLFDEPTLNTLSKEEALLRQQTGTFKIKEIKKITSIKIEKIIKEYMDNVAPDLISLDVEGIDYDILASFDFETYRVPVWVIETCEYSENHIKPKVQIIIDLMLEKGYFVYADTYINTIFVEKNWFYNFKSDS